jgi:hypothetical protein
VDGASDGTSARRGDNGIEGWHSSAMGSRGASVRARDGERDFSLHGSAEEWIRVVHVGRCQSSTRWVATNGGVAH